MDDLDVELWSELPSEIVERTLSYLSMPVLCRFRTVCKRWNSLICNPEFGALCVQHARQDALFIVAPYAYRGKACINIEESGYCRPFCVNHGWSFLDLHARRWYTIQHDNQEVYEFGSVAMDGGLVCQFLNAVEMFEVVAVIVSNPIAKTSRRLPCAPYYSTIGTPAKLNMVVDNIRHNYKIFLMPHGRVVLDVPPPMVVYESTTNRWRSTTKLPMGPFGDGSCVRCSVFFDGLLYVLMCPTVIMGATEHWLWSYDHVADAWKDTCVNIHLTRMFYPELIVSDNRLFLVSWLLKLSDIEVALGKWLYEVSEVLLGDQTCSIVFQLTSPDVAQEFGKNRSAFSKLQLLHAFGLGKSIVFLCESTGVSKVYDLSTSSWDMLPENPLKTFYNNHVIWHGKPMNLILPGSTQWVHQT